jgi:uncharacterized integral membrane protein
MLWYYVAVTVFHIDVQQDPKPAILLAIVVALLLWVLVGLARRREVRRARNRDLSGWRSRQPPR